MDLAIKTTGATLLYNSGAFALADHLGPRNGGMILNLHRVLPAGKAELAYDAHTVMSAESFRALLEFLGRRYKVVDMETLLHDREESKSQKIALTFDDGWIDTFEVVRPLLLRFGMAATVFVCTDLAGTVAMLPEERLTRIYDLCRKGGVYDVFVNTLQTWAGRHDCIPLENWSAFAKGMTLSTKLSFAAHMEERLGICCGRKASFMNWNQIRSMASAGFEIGSHTACHATLGAEDREVVRLEMTRSLRRIKFETGEKPKYFAYPNGSLNAVTEQIAMEVGYQQTFSTVPRAISNRYRGGARPRIPMDDTLMLDANGRFSAARAAFHLLRWRR
ncbi:polysaccharide deacetylase family protein [Terriglobus roseus]|uniref:Polysaccharide deacetylase n=1 Tax=Terriglobus roseus TaxID=392734 RepID=A0A1H4SJM4_9BACT|nr:polysaccharide deacetylase family protein [Terriglobus roseus]SEC44051.1 Polysaccharide deacetylase [Terriglobus roseus]